MNDQKTFVPTIRTLIYSTFLKATIDAANEVLIRQGQVLSEQQVAEISESESAKFRSNIKLLHSFDGVETITKIYAEQWIDVFLYLQEKLTKLTH